MSIKEFETAKGLSSDEYLTKKGVIPNFWQEILVECSSNNASDIYIQQSKNTILIRAKVNGQCIIIKEKKFEKSASQKSTIDFFKGMCHLDLSTDQKAQDVSFELDMTKSKYRLALSPTPLGEYIVLRIIREDFLPNLQDCNLCSETEKDLRWALQQGQGLICITGPTGSGKSSTLQACLMELDRVKNSVLTIENPVERSIPGTAQIEVTPSFGWNEAIKQAMRQAPDIILIGEIRDAESASLAMKAAQTGHLVLTTLHTNDAAGIVDRLIGLGVDRHIIADNLLFISAQRLLKKICPSCKIPDNEYFIEGNGCSDCNHKVIIGRIPIVEYGIQPSAKSIFNFDKENFKKNELKALLLDEADKLARKGIISKNSLIPLGGRFE